MENKTWPVDPNAPKNTIQDVINSWLKHGSKVAHIGSNKAALPKDFINFKDIVAYYPLTPNECFLPELTDDQFTQLKARANRPYLITPLTEFEMPQIEMDNILRNPKVTPREQRNRERFNRNRR